MWENIITDTITESIEVKNRILEDKEIIATLSAVASKCVEALEQGNRILLAGNGGSAADAQHIAAEFVGRYAFDRPGLPSLALTTDTSMLTAIANDYGCDQVFSRQIEANANQGDVFIGLSTSGKSSNIIVALRRARDLGLLTVGFTGKGGGELMSLCDFCLRVPSTSTPRIQESHIMLAHIMCGLVEDSLFNQK